MLNMLPGKKLQTYSAYVAIVLIVVASVFSYSCYISNTHIYGLDELLYMESSREMINTGNYVIPYFNRKVRIRKPILFYWFVIGSYKLFGETVTAARLPSLFLAFLGVFVLCKFYMLLFSDKKGAFYSVAILLSSFHYMYHARMSTLDMTLTTFILISFYYLAKGIWEGNHCTNFFISSVFTGLAVITKGPIGVIIPYLTIILFVLLFGKEEKTVIKYYFFSLPNIFAVISLGIGWYILLFFKLGWEELHHVLIIELISRVNDPNLSILKNFFRHIVNLFRVMFPWFFCFIPVLLNVKKIKKIITGTEIKGVYFLLIWVFVVLLVFLFVFPYYARYLLPVVPPCAMLLGYFTVKLESVLKSSDIYPLLLFTFTAAAVVFLICYFLAVYFLPDIASSLGVLSFFWLLGTISLRMGKNNNDFKVFVFTTAMLLLLTYPLIFGGVATFFKENPFNAMAQEHIINLRESDSLVTVGMDKKNRTWLTFLGKHFIDKHFNEDTGFSEAKAYLESLEPSKKYTYIILPAKLLESLSEKSRFSIISRGKKFQGRIPCEEICNKLSNLGILMGIRSFQKEYLLVRV